MFQTDDGGSDRDPFDALKWAGPQAIELALISRADAVGASRLAW